MAVSISNCIDLIKEHRESQCIVIGIDVRRYGAIYKPVDWGAYRDSVAYLAPLFAVAPKIFVAK